MKGFYLGDQISELWTDAIVRCSVFFHRLAVRCMKSHSSDHVERGEGGSA